jgi:hypothetical protein
MGSSEFVVNYVQACTIGNLPLSECGPVWQLGIIAVLLVSAFMALIAVRVSSNARSAQG